MAPKRNTRRGTKSLRAVHRPPASTVPFITRIDVGPMPGPGVVSASREEVADALRLHPPELDWNTARENVLPVLPRVRPFPPGYPDPLQTIIAPGIVVGFGIDIGPAFIGVGEGLLHSWGISMSDVSARAIANVHDRAARIDRTAIVRHPIGDVLTLALQTGLSIGSTLVVAPGHLRRLFGPEPRLFITPMRDLLVGLPADVDPEFALWLHVEFATLDPNCLGPGAYRFDGQRIVPMSLALDAPTRPASISDPPFHIA